jgi:hypothetical protein
MARNYTMTEEEEIALNRSFVFEQIMENPKLITIIKNRYLDDDMLEKCIDAEPTVFRYIKNPSMRIIRAGLIADGGNLAYIPESCRENLPSEFFIFALQSNLYGAIQYVPEDQLHHGISTEIKEKLIFERDPEIAYKYGVSLREEFLRDRIRYDPSLIKYVVDPSDELKCLALEQDPNIALYFDELTPKMMDVIDRKYPSLKGSLPNYTR